MSKVRAIRLSPAEEKQIQEFLRRNPFFDFSTVTRLALVRFMENPSLNLKAVPKDGLKSKRSDANA